ncbi:calcium-binding protein, partial [Paraburkholderia sediminicola]|uniref:calcium-binding protein n=1 Tax=Paraburkholderia sediminicola TaxID=458836 RepID=UPI0038BD2EAA
MAQTVSNNAVNLTPAQISGLQSYLDSGQYANGYTYLQNIVESQPNYENDTGLQNLSNWLGKAADINGDPNSIYGSFVRGATEGLGDYLNDPIDDTTFQNASNLLAQSVFNNVISGNAIPDINTIIGQDVNSAVQNLDLPPWGWAGTWGDVLPPPFGLGGDYQSIDGGQDGDPLVYAQNWMNSFASQIDGLERMVGSQVEQVAQEIAKEIGNALGNMLGKASEGAGNGPSPYLPGGGDGGDGATPADPANPAGGAQAANPANGHMGNAGNRLSPLVIDLTGNGIQLTPLSANSPYFDLTGDGFARKTGWVGQGTGLLCFDPSDGPIEGISQLFGSGTVDGFTLLSKLDSNGDRVIDASDSAFSQLRVWVDSNSDGQTEAGELFTLAQLGIVSINLKATSVDQQIAGNAINLISSVTLANGTTREIADAWFNNSATYTRPVEQIIISSDVAALPQLAGYGVLRDLQSSMMLDPTLKSLVSAFAALPAGTDSATIESEVTQVLYQWAGTENLSPNSRGGYIDARKLGFVESYLGQQFDSANDGTIPGFRAGSDANAAWNNLYDAAIARLVLQSPVAASFGKFFTWEAAADVVLPATGFSEALAGLLQTIGAPDAGNQVQWDLALRIADAARIDLRVPVDVYHQLVETATNVTVAALASAVASDLPFTVDSSGNVSISGSPVNDEMYATAGSSVLHGNGGGNNWAATLNTNDVFVVEKTAVTVEIDEQDPGAPVATNTLQLGSSIHPADVTVVATGAGDVLLSVQGGPQIKLDGMAARSTSGVELVQFIDGTVWTRAQILQMCAQGTAGSDFIFGTVGGDVLDGKGGNDFVEGFGGGDTFVFNQGYGHLEIDEVDVAANPSNVLSLGAGITSSRLAARGDASGNLTITTGTAGDQIVIDGMLANRRDGVQQIQFADGTVWSAAQLIQLATTGTAGADSLYGSSGADLFDGHGGGDYESGGGGNDTFVFNAGYGQLEINEQDFTSGDVNVLELGGGIVAASTTVSFSGNNIILTDSISGDGIQLDGMLQWGYDGVQQIRFADGTVWAASQIAA